MEEVVFEQGRGQSVLDCPVRSCGCLAVFRCLLPVGSQSCQLNAEPRANVEDGCIRHGAWLLGCPGTSQISTHSQRVTHGGHDFDVSWPELMD